MAKITVYTTSTCPYCVLLTNFLKEQHIAFKEINIENDQETMEWIVSQTGQFGVPQTNINGRWVLGFDPDKIVSAINN